MGVIQIIYIFCPQSLLVHITSKLGQKQGNYFMKRYDFKYCV